MTFFTAVSLAFSVACPVLFYLWRVAARKVEAQDKVIKSLRDELRSITNVYSSWREPPLATNWEVTEAGVSVKTADDQVHMLESLVGKGILFGAHENGLAEGVVLAVHDRYLQISREISYMDKEDVTVQTWSHVNLLHIKVVFDVSNVDPA